MKKWMMILVFVTMTTTTFAWQVYDVQATGNDALGRRRSKMVLILQDAGTIAPSGPFVAATMPAALITVDAESKTITVEAAPVVKFALTPKAHADNNKGCRIYQSDTVVMTLTEATEGLSAVVIGPSVYTARYNAARVRLGDTQTATLTGNMNKTAIGRELYGNLSVRFNQAESDKMNVATTILAGNEKAVAQAYLTRLSDSAAVAADITAASIAGTIPARFAW